MKRLILNDTAIHEAIFARKELARVFQVDSLIASKDPLVHKGSTGLAATLINKVAYLEPSDVVIQSMPWKRFRKLSCAS
jgi:hypothetical protein